MLPERSGCVPTIIKMRLMKSRGQRSEGIARFQRMRGLILEIQDVGRQISEPKVTIKENKRLLSLECSIKRGRNV